MLYKIALSQFVGAARKGASITSLLIGLTFLTYGNATIILGLNPPSDIGPFNLTGVAYLTVSIFHPKLQSRAYMINLVFGAALILSLDVSELENIMSFRFPRLVAEALVIYSLLAFNILFSVRGLMATRFRR